MLRIARHWFRFAFAFGLVDEVTESILVVGLVLDVKDVCIGVAATLFDSFSGKDWLLLVPLIFMQRFNFLLLVIQFIPVFDLDIDCFEVVDGLCRFFSISFGFTQR